MYIGLAVIAIAVIAAMCFVAYLLFCKFVVNKTGSTDGLRDVATAMRAYKVPLPGRQPKDSTSDVRSDAELPPPAPPRADR